MLSFKGIAGRAGPNTTVCCFSRGPSFLRRPDANPRSPTYAGHDPRLSGHATASGLDRGVRGPRAMHPFAGLHVVAETADAAGNDVAAAAFAASAASARVVA